MTKNLIKGKGQFVQKVIFNLWWISNKTVMEIGNLTKTATFKSFFQQVYKNTLLSFFWVFFVFMRQTLTDNFWELHKNKNWAFSLKSFNAVLQASMQLKMGLLHVYFSRTLPTAFEHLFRKMHFNRFRRDLLLQN